MKEIRMNDVTEKELIKVSVTPRVTREALEARILSEKYFTAADGIAGSDMHYKVEEGSSLDRLTFAILVLDNGFTVTGQSACASPENYNPEIGRRIAREDAVKKMWALLGFELRTALAKVEKAHPLRGKIADMGGKTYIGTKVIHAVPMTRGEYNKLRGWELPKDKNGDDVGYLVHYADQDQTNVAGFTGYISWSPKDVFEKAYKQVA